MLELMSRYPIGAVVQRRSGYIFVKIEEGTWVPEHRLVGATAEKRELMDGERVYHKDGDRENNKPENLVIIRFNKTKYRLLARPRVLYLPGSNRAPVKEALAARIGDLAVSRL